MKDNIKTTNKKKIIFIAVSITLVILIIAGVAFGIIMSSDKHNDVGGASSDNTVSNDGTASDTSSTNNGNDPIDSESSYSSTDSNVIPTIDFSKRAEKIVKRYDYVNEFAAPKYQQLYFDDTLSGKRLSYWLCLPENYDPNQKYPVLLFLHGLGDKSPTTTLRLSGYPDSGDIIRRAIIIFPHTPDWWNLDEKPNDNKGWLSAAMRLLLDVEKTYSCDPNRIYLTGVSMGGFATWDLLARYDSHFAAAVPLCGGTDERDEAFADVYKNIPIWIFHGTDDNVVPVICSDNIYNAIIKAGGTKIKYSRLRGVQHNVHGEAYKNREMWSWMFSQNKATNPDASYKMFDYVTVCNSKGKVLFNQREVFGATNRAEDGVTNIGIKFTDNGIKILTAAYNANKNEEFTLYIGQNKFFTFKYTSAPTDNMIYISGFNDYDTRLEITLFFSDVAYR